MIKILQNHVIVTIGGALYNIFNQLYIVIRYHVMSPQSLVILYAHLKVSPSCRWPVHHPREVQLCCFAI